MKVRLSTEISKYIIIAKLETELKNGKPYQKTYEEQRTGESKNHAEVKALLLGCRKLNQNMDFTLELDIASTYIRISVNSMEKWNLNDWKNSKGKPVTYAAEWKEIYELTKKYNIEFK